MKKNTKTLNRYHGQTVLEYVVLTVIVTMVLVFMGTDIKRGIQSAVKTTADQLGTQANADQDFERKSGASGVLTNSTTSAWQSQGHSTRERAGIITIEESDMTQILTNSQTNAGLTEDI